MINNILILRRTCSSLSPRIPFLRFIPSVSGALKGVTSPRWYTDELPLDWVLTEIPTHPWILRSRVTLLETRSLKDLVGRVWTD